MRDYMQSVNSKFSGVRREDAKTIRRYGDIFEIEEFQLLGVTETKTTVFYNKEEYIIHMVGGIVIAIYLNN